MNSKDAELVLRVKQALRPRMTAENYTEGRYTLCDVCGAKTPNVWWCGDCVGGGKVTRYHQDLSSNSYPPRFD